MILFKYFVYTEMQCVLLFIYNFIYIYIKLVTLVKGDPKAPFSIATTPSWRVGRYSIPWIAPLPMIRTL